MPTTSMAKQILFLSWVYINYIIFFIFIIITIAGGVNGATGSIIDGSSGGMLNDMFMLRLTNYSTEGIFL